MIRLCAATFGLAAALLAVGWQNASGAELLVNGGFEEGTTGWSVSADTGQLDSVNSPVRSGSQAARLSGGGQPSTLYMYQWLDVQPGQSYQFDSWVILNDLTVQMVYLRVEWFNASGEQIGSKDSLAPLTDVDPAYRQLMTGQIVSPMAATSARVSGRVRASAPFVVLFDDFSFQGPSPSPTPVATSSPMPTPPPAPTPSVTSSPAPSVAPVPTPAPTSTQAPEPLVYPQLVNGGFEEVRDDGTPYGWRKQGGDMTAAIDVKAEGARSLALRSSTISTKWAYQTIAVTGNAYYEATAQTAAGPGVDEAFLRISWYTSADGSGPAGDQVDSPSSSSDSGFHSITTGAVRAPTEARSARVRLMLRPLSEAPATVYFDAVTFSQTLVPTSDFEEGTAPRPRSSLQRPGAIAAAQPEGGAAPVLAAAATPVRLANMKPADVADAQRTSSGGNGGPGWAVALALVAPVAALALAGGYELWRRRAVTDE